MPAQPFTLVSFIVFHVAVVYVLSSFHVGFISSVLFVLFPSVRWAAFFLHVAGRTEKRTRNTCGRASESAPETSLPVK